MEKLIGEQEKQIESYMRENLDIKEELENLKTKTKTEIRILEHKLREVDGENKELKTKAERIRKQLTLMEIENETHQSQNRIKEEIIKNLNYKTSNLNEKLTMLQVETEEIKNLEQEEVEHLREHLKETEEELMALKKKSQLKRRSHGY
jgi:hypothetical protein